MKSRRIPQLKLLLSPENNIRVRTSESNQKGKKEKSASISYSNTGLSTLSNNLFLIPQNNLSQNLKLNENSRINYIFNKTCPNSQRRVILPNEIQKLNTIIGKKDAEIQNFKFTIMNYEKKSPKKIHTGKTFKNNEFNYYDIINENHQFLEKEELKALQESLNDIIFRLETSNNSVMQRCHKMDELITLFEYEKEKTSNFDLIRIKDLIKNVNDFCSNISKLEIELNFKTRELDKKNLEFSIMLNKNKKLLDYVDKMQSELNNNKFQINELLNEKLKDQKNLLSQKKDSSEFQKKFNNVSKRIEFILESDLGPALNNQDKVRTSLTELMKENLNLKKEIQSKNKEIDRLHEKNNKSLQKIDRLTRKINNFKKEKNDENNEDDDQLQNEKNPLNILSNNLIPANLDYRITSLKNEYANLIADIIEHGNEAFTKHIFSNSTEKKDTQKKEEISLVTSQFLSFKEFSEKMNILLKEISKMFELKTINSLQRYVNSNFKKVFLSEKINLWMADFVTGIYYTTTIDKKKIECLMTHGLFGELTKLGKPMNRREIKTKILYQKINEKNSVEKVESTLLFPIKNENQRIIGILEISNIYNDLFGFDEEYFGIVLNEYLTHVCNKLISIEIYESVNKYSNYIYQSFIDLLRTNNNLFEFTKVFKIWVKKLFSSSQSKILFIENDSLVEYKTEKIYLLDQGFAGQVIKFQKSLILSDCKKSTIYDKEIDIESLLPLYVYPILDNDCNENSNTTIAVIEIILKQKLQIKEEKNSLLQNQLSLGLDFGNQKNFEIFCEFIKTALILFKKSNKI